MPLEPGRHIVYARHDLSDLESLCARYSADDTLRSELYANSAAFFDRYLHRD